jgi:hypothetical protein
MIRPMTSATAIRRLGAIAVVILLAIGCGDAAVTAQPTGVPTAIVDAAACAVETPPGPDDQVPDPGEIDTTDLGNGRWRLCLTEPVAFSVEGSAWCSWTEDRAAVREAMGLPLPIGAAGSTVDGGIVIVDGVVYLASNDPRMISSWQGGPDGVQANAQPDGTSGTAAFRIPATVDQESPPVMAPPSAAGVVSWQCGDPPPPAS